MHNEVDVLWTSGWDSTFRVIFASAIRKLTVKPHYIADRERPSTSVELRTIEELRSLILNRFPETKILPATVVAKEEIPEEASITDAYLRMRKASHLGSQYDFLPRYARSGHFAELELCIHRDDKAYRHVAPYCVPIEESGDTYYRISEKFASTDAALVFGRFRFPILQLTKRDMKDISGAMGFSEIMEKTWFCYTPTADGKPCGLCNPCMSTIQEGLGRRIPPISRLKYYSKPIKDLVPNSIKQRIKQGLKRLHGGGQRLSSEPPAETF